MKELEVRLGERSYPILVGQSPAGLLGGRLGRLGLSQKALLVSNPTVYALHGVAFRQALEAEGLTVQGALVPDGEEAKSIDVASLLYDKAVAAGLDRHSAVFALGGGVVGDLAGFVAATYLRGLPLIQVPTTLLAQVDSSVGGKVAVNHPRGKNLIGAFYQPRLVLAGLSTLATLPLRELRAGLAEVIKYGVICDAAFFAFLEDRLEAILALEPQAVEETVLSCCAFKAAVVEEDEREEGRRAILNFGHTVGHALEALTNYNTYRHGEAVAMGMAAAARIASRLGLLAEDAEERLRELLQRAGLPVELPPGLDGKALLEAMQQDKKKRDNRLTLVLPEALGRVRLCPGLAGEEVLRLLF